MRKAYAVALACGALPVIAGLSIYLLWERTRWGWLVPAGICTLIGGLVLFAEGGMVLRRYARLGSEALEMPRRFRLKVIFGATLLLSNFPAAGAIVWSVITHEFRYTVVVRNESSVPLEDVRVAGGRCEAFFDPVPPGEEEEESFWVQHDGSLVLRWAGSPPKEIVGYVTSSQGGHTTATVHPDGTVTAVDRD